MGFSGIIGCRVPFWGLSATRIVRVWSALLAVSWTCYRWGLESARPAFRHLVLSQKKIQCLFRVRKEILPQVEDRWMDVPDTVVNLQKFGGSPYLHDLGFVYFFFWFVFFIFLVCFIFRLI